MQDLQVTVQDLQLILRVSGFAVFDPVEEGDKTTFVATLRSKAINVVVWNKVYAGSDVPRKIIYMNDPKTETLMRSNSYPNNYDAMLLVRRFKAVLDAYQAVENAKIEGVTFEMEYKNHNELLDSLK